MDTLYEMKSKTIEMLGAGVLETSRPQGFADLGTLRGLKDAGAVPPKARGGRIGALTENAPARLPGRADRGLEAGMNVAGVMRSHELPLEVPEYLAEDIDALVAAMERDDPDLDCYMDEVEGSARGVGPEEDDWIRQYYLRGGWSEDGVLE